MRRLAKWFWWVEGEELSQFMRKLGKDMDSFLLAFYIDCFCAEMLFSSLIGDFSFSSLHMFFFFLEKFSNFYRIFVFNWVYLHVMLFKFWFLFIFSEKKRIILIIFNDMHGNIMKITYFSSSIWFCIQLESWLQRFANYANYVFHWMQGPKTPN